MKNLFKNSVFFNIFIFLVFNIFFLDLYFPALLVLRVPSGEVYEKYITDFAVYYMYFVILNRFYLLPLYFHILYKYTQNSKIKMLLQEFKSSVKVKCSFLIFGLLISPILGTTFCMIMNHNISDIDGYFKLCLLFVPFIGLYQVYLILYLIWWIGDTYSNIGKKYAISVVRRRRD